MIDTPPLLVADRQAYLDGVIAPDASRSGRPKIFPSVENSNGTIAISMISSVERKRMS